MPIEISMPALDPAMTEARVVKWLKAEGDRVEKGDALVEIETDKAVVEVEAEERGTFGKSLIAGGKYAAVNSVIGLLLKEGENSSALGNYGSGQVPDSECGGRDTEKTPPDTSDEVLGTRQHSTRKSGRVFASPLARRLATQQGLDLAALVGSGPNGRIIKRDINSAQSVQSSYNVVSQSHEKKLAGELAYLPDFERLEVNAMGKTIARRLTESSQNVPHYYLTIDCNLDQLLLQRKEINVTLEESSKLSVNDFIVKAVAHAMLKVPNANVMWAEQSIFRFKEIDISLAVAIDGGLITPVIRNAGNKNILETSSEIKRLVAKAREGKLLPKEYQGGTFTISNLGMFGIKQFTSIINPPQAGILSVGAAEQRPIVKNGEFEIATIMSLTLGADHRCINGAIGAEFLAAFKGFIEAPITMFVRES
jgi:pyruvate dehydrogenase E2 component (dihydrolipoamide acetyltransferase)